MRDRATNGGLDRREINASSEQLQAEITASCRQVSDAAAALRNGPVNAAALTAAFNAAKTLAYHACILTVVVQTQPSLPFATIRACRTEIITATNALAFARGEVRTTLHLPLENDAAMHNSPMGFALAAFRSTTRLCRDIYRTHILNELVYQIYEEVYEEYLTWADNMHTALIHPDANIREIARHLADTIAHTPDISLDSDTEEDDDDTEGAKTDSAATTHLPAEESDIELDDHMLANATMPVSSSSGAASSTASSPDTPDSGGAAAAAAVADTGDQSPAHDSNDSAAHDNLGNALALITSATASAVNTSWTSEDLEAEIEAATPTQAPAPSTPPPQPSPSSPGLTSSQEALPPLTIDLATSYSATQLSASDEPHMPETDAGSTHTGSIEQEEADADNEDSASGSRSFSSWFEQVVEPISEEPLTPARVTRHVTVSEPGADTGGGHIYFKRILPNEAPTSTAHVALAKIWEKVSAPDTSYANTIDEASNPIPTAPQSVGGHTVRPCHPSVLTSGNRADKT